MLTRHAAIAILASTLAASSAHAGVPPVLDLTGTWQATFQCKEVDFSGIKQKTTTTVTVLQLQAADRVYGQIQFAPTATGPRGTLSDFGPFCGISLMSADKPGTGRVGYTATSGQLATVLYEMPVFPGTADLAVSVFEPDAKGISGRMNGNGLFDFAVTTLTGAGLGTCKVKMERTSTAVPVLETDVTDTCDQVFDLIP